jgi:ribosomal-protein-alanine N-acetyltransferase
MTVTGAVKLRRWRIEDLDALAGYANNRKIWMNLRDRFPHPYTRVDAEAWIRLCLVEEEPALQFAIDLADEAVGGIGFERLTDVHRLTAEIGYWIGEPFWGRGIASAAVAEATAYGFVRLGLERIQAAVFAENRASVRVLEKSGFTCEGCLRRSVLKDARILDSFLYARVR